MIEFLNIFRLESGKRFIRHKATGRIAIQWIHLYSEEYFYLTVNEYWEVI